jgi:hypothetical protein
MPEHTFEYFGNYPVEILENGRPVPTYKCRRFGGEFTVKTNRPSTISFRHVPVPRSQVAQAKQRDTLFW